MKEKQLYIGDVARQVSVNTKTIRYYEDIDLLPKSNRENNNYRVYSRDTIKRLNFIKKAKNLGFTLKEIKEIITLRDSGFKPCNHVQDLLKQRIIDLELKLVELTTLRRELKKLENEWSKIEKVKDDMVGGICPQIERVGIRLTRKSSKTIFSRK